MFVGDLYLVLHLQEHQPRFSDHPFEHHAVELYDRRIPADQRMNLAAEQPEVARRMRAMLLDWLTEAPADTFAAEAVENDELAAQLEALGYTGSSDVPYGDFWQPDDCERCREYTTDH